ncbi:hypothetical protein H8E88_29695 [candidate division KSB1 bacterium]|nr:hypothetical protein [candidate division KSB1 bacterium]MBL7092716.1 hypothetical protein [candidate division KSB1 bacterium]
MTRKPLTQRQRFFKALKFEEPDRPPHFELHFELEEEAFGLKAVTQEEWQQATSTSGKEILFVRSAEIYAKTVEAFQWDAVASFSPSHEYEFFPFLKKELGDDIPIASMIWGACISIETVSDYMQFSVDLYENPKKLHEWARSLMDSSLDRAKRLIDAGCDFIVVPSDIAHNQGPFISPRHCREFIFPYLKELVDFIQKNGVPVIYHTDGDLLPIMDDLLDIRPDGLQSIDPLAGMDIAEVKKLTYGEIALMGNVDCGAVQYGPIEKIIESAEYALTYGPKGGGYIYSSSNTIFKGIPLENYRVMLDYFHNKFPLV